MAKRFIWRSSWTSICEFFHTFFQKVSQSVPLALQARPGAPKSYHQGAHGSQNTAPGSSKWRPSVSECSPRVLKNMPPDCPCPDAARGSQKLAPKKTAHVRHPLTSVLLLARRLFCPKSGDLHNKKYVTTSNMGLHTQMSQHVYM